MTLLAYYACCCCWRPAVEADHVFCTGFIMFIATSCSRCTLFCQYRPRKNAAAPIRAAPATVPTTIPAMSPPERPLEPPELLVLELLVDVVAEEDDDEDELLVSASETLKHGMSVVNELYGT